MKKLLGVIVLVSVVFIVSIPQTFAQMIYACIDDKGGDKGDMRFVPGPGMCKKGEFEISWIDPEPTEYTGNSPINVDNTLYTIGLNPATSPGDLMTWDGNHWIARQPAAHSFPQDSNMQPYTTINFQIALQGIFPSRSAYEPFLGEIMMVGWNFETLGWAFCNGQLLSISQNTALFSLLGTIYGGNGVSTFALPDLRGRVPMHWGHGPGLQSRDLGEMGGSETINW